MLRLASLTASRRLLPWTPTTARCRRAGGLGRFRAYPGGDKFSTTFLSALPPVAGIRGRQEPGPPRCRAVVDPAGTLRRAAPGRGAPSASLCRSCPRRSRSAAPQPHLYLQRGACKTPPDSSLNPGGHAASHNAACRSPATVSARGIPRGWGLRTRAPGPLRRISLPRRVGGLGRQRGRAVCGLWARKMGIDRSEGTGKSVQPP